MKLPIQRLNNPALVLAGALVAMAIIRIPVPDGQMRSLFQLLAESCVMIAFGLLVVMRVNKWVGLFLLLAVFSSVHPVFDKSSYIARNAVLTGCLWYFMVGRLRLAAWNINYIYNGICIIGMINTVFAVMQRYGIDPYALVTFGAMKSEVAGKAYSGLVANPNTLSALLAFSIPAFMRQYWWPGILIVTAGLVVAKSTGGLIAGTAGITFYILAAKRHYYLLIMIGLGALLFFRYVDMPRINGGDRVEKWVYSLHYIKQHWLTGYGLGHWKTVFYKVHRLYDVTWFSKAHNEFLQGYFEMGLAFILVVIGYVANVCRRYRREALIQAMALVIIGINSLVNFPFHIATTAMIAVTWMAVLEIKLGDER